MIQVTNQGLRTTDSGPSSIRELAVVVILIPWVWFVLAVVHPWLSQEPNLEFPNQASGLGFVALLMIRPLSTKLALALPTLSGTLLFLKPDSKVRLILTGICVLIALPVIGLSLILFGFSGVFAYL